MEKGVIDLDLRGGSVRFMFCHPVHYFGLVGGGGRRHILGTCRQGPKRVSMWGHMTACRKKNEGWGRL